MSSLKFLFLSLAAATFLNSASASDICKNALQTKDAGNDNVSQTAPFPPITEAFPYGRGLIDTKVPANPETLLKAKSLGYNEWGLRIYPVESLEQAMTHFNKENFRDMSMQCFYLLLPKGMKYEAMTQEARQNYETQPEEDRKQIGSWSYKSLIKNGARLVYLHKDQISHQRIQKQMEELKDQAAKDPKAKPALDKIVKIFENFLSQTSKKESYQYKTLPIEIVNNLTGDTKEDKWTDVPAHVAEKISSPEISILSKEDGELFYQFGWFAPEAHGVILVDDFVKSSNFKEMEKFSKNLLAKGYQFTVNKNMRQVMTSAGEMVRKEKTTQGNSRFSEATMKSYEELVATNKAFSIEIWHPTGVLAGGVFGLMSDGVVGGDSVFYPRKNDPDVMQLKNLFENDPRFAQYAKDPLFSKSIDFGKLAVYFLIKTLQKNGIKFMDAGMVTVFTQSLTGKYIWQKDFMQLVADAKKSAPEKISFIEDQGKLADGVTYTSMKKFVEKNKK